MVEMNYARIEIPILYCVNLDTSITKYYFSTFELPVGKLGKIDNTVDARSTRKSFPKPVSKVENQTVQTLQTREREREREGAGSGMVTKAKSSEFQFARRRDPCVYLAIANIPPCKSSNPFPFFPFYPFGLFFLFLSFFFFLFLLLFITRRYFLTTKKGRWGEMVEGIPSRSIDSRFFISLIAH